MREPKVQTKLDAEADGAASDGAVSARDRILRAALQEFSLKGVSGARVDQIALLAGANKQLLYHYFGSKDALFKAVLEQVFMRARTGDKAFAAEVASLAPVAAVLKFMDYMCASTWAQQEFQRIVLEDALNEAKHLKNLPEVPVAYGFIVGVLADILKRGAEAKVFRADVDSRELYVSMMGMFGIRFSNARTLTVSVGLPLSDEAGFARSRNAVAQFVLAALRP